MPKLSKGDTVAVLSPSAGLPGLFPSVFEQGLDRLRDVFGLIPIEYPTTRHMNSPLAERARDIMDAFSDPSIKAIFTSIGGDDQIKLIKHLDPSVLINNPKPFVGYSDNTHLHNYLWSLGIPSYYGGAIMTQFAIPEQMTKITARSLHHALFDSGEYELPVSEAYNDETLQWSSPDSLTTPRKWEPNDGAIWDGDTSAEGVLWGGCVESLIVQAAANIYIPTNEEIDGAVLFIETAEDIPEQWVIEYLLTGFGERGWFDRFQAVLVGRPKTWEFNKQLSAVQKENYRKEQQETVIRVVREYNQTIPIVQNLDFGHTDPQVVLPMGNMARVDSKQRKIYLRY